MSNSIVIGALTFTDSNIVEGSINQQMGAIGDELVIDSLGIKIFTTSMASLLAIPRGTAASIYNGTTRLAKMYVSSITRVGANIAKVTCISAVGMIDGETYNGGIYPDASITDVGDIVAELLDGYTYTIDSEVSSTGLKGWLPRGTKRECLHQVLFSCGASIVKGTDGDIRICYLHSGQPISFPNSRMGIGGTIEYLEKATRVEVTEHSFYALASDKLVTLFDGSDGFNVADHELVTWKNPCHDITATNLTVHESSCNHAIVSGNGTLTGKEYSHTQHVVGYDTGVLTDTKVVTVTDCYLVNTLNSLNTAKRLAEYYGNADLLNAEIVSSNEHTGDELNVAHPFGGRVNGFITSLDTALSSLLKSVATFAINWQPAFFGNNITGHQMITASGTYNVPAGATTLRFVLIGGGSGGAAGANGSNGEDGDNNIGLDAEGGNGGAGGAGGNGGKIYTIDVPVGSATQFTVSVGSGGASGSDGTATTVTINGATYSSATGAVSNVGIVDVISGDVYGMPGISGLAGAKGGGQSDDEFRESGYDFEFNGVTYRGGSIGEEEEYKWKPTGLVNTSHAGGGFGGGAAYGSAGGNGGNGTATNRTGSTEGGGGGNGANASARPDTTIIGNGGDGGFGGGGGGAGGQTWLYTGPPYETHHYEQFGDGGTGGTGGTGGAGAKGGPGGAILYY